MSKKIIRMVVMLLAFAVVALPLIGQLRAQEGAATQPATATQPSADAQRVVITIGDEKITAAEFNDFVSDLPPQYQQMVQGTGKRMLAEELVKFKLLSAEARRRGLESSPKVQRQLAMIQDQVLASALAEELQAGSRDEDLKKYYDEHPGEFDQVTARHILIRTPESPIPAEEGKEQLTDEQAKAKAQDIRKRIEAGEDFAAIAKTESVDTKSGANGGELGTFGRGQMVGPFEEAAFGMKAGELSQPIKTQFGYHVIQVREKKSPAFEEVKAQLRSRLGPQQVDQTVKQLREQTKTELDESFFGPPAAPVPPATGAGQ